MTEQQLEKFKERVYDPYIEAWSIIKAFRDVDPRTDDDWERYIDACNKFATKYPTEIGDSICRVMIDAGSEIGHIERKGLAYVDERRESEGFVE